MKINPNYYYYTCLLIFNIVTFIIYTYNYKFNILNYIMLQLISTMSNPGGYTYLHVDNAYNVSA